MNPNQNKGRQQQRPKAVTFLVQEVQAKGQEFNKKNLTKASQGLRFALAYIRYIMELNYIPKIVIISSIFLVTSVLSEQTHNNHEFDFMLFAQVWPISGCIEWEERNDANTCSLPST